MPVLYRFRVKGPFPTYLLPQSACDLHELFSSNILLKYADATYLIVPAPNSALIQQELDHCVAVGQRQ